MSEHQEQNLAALSEQARDTFGEEASYTYFHDGTAYSLTLEEAYEVCGEYIAGVPTEVALKLLSDMHEIAANMERDEAENPDSGNRFTESLSRGKALLARRALSQQE